MKIFFTFILIIYASSISSQDIAKTEYYRHLRYNHVSPYISIAGIHPITKANAEGNSHYIFKYDRENRLREVINHHHHTEKKHPLASLGVYKLMIDYTKDQEIWKFFDPNGLRISNDRNVYKEVYTYDKKKVKSKLQFYDLNDLPMESNWAIAEYHWEQKKKMVVERRYNLKKEMVNVSPYFDFGVTGIVVNKQGAPVAHFNLNDKLQVSNNSIGIASYKDVFDAEGNHIKYSYYNADDQLAMNQWKFAVGKKSYDSLGNNILLEQLDTDGKVTRSRPVYSNATIEMSPAASSQDSAEIRKQSLGYLKALQQLDPILMKEVMNDSLNKVTIGYNREAKKEMARATTYDQMIAFAKDWNKSNMKFPTKANNDVTILSIYNRIASVKLVSDNWVEYLHLIKLDGTWDIVNLIWQHKDISRYPK